MQTLVIDRVALERITPETAPTVLEVFKAHLTAVKAAEKKGIVKSAGSFVNPPGGYMIVDTPSNEELLKFLGTLPANMFIERELRATVGNEFIQDTILPAVAEQLRSTFRK
jgi:hypothetical protein